MVVVVSLLVLAGWLAWSPDPILGGSVTAAAPGHAPLPVDPASVGASSATGRPLPAATPGAQPVRATAAGGGLRLIVCVPPPLSAAVVVTLLRRPDFAPRVRFDDEVWRVFAADAGAGGRAACVLDRLARLGYQAVADRALPACGEVSFTAGELDDACVALGLGAHAVGYVALTGGGSERMVLVGAGELDVPDSDGEVWAWSASPFPGPHRAGAGRRIPAARTHALQVLRRAAPPTLRYLEPVTVPAGGVQQGWFVARVAWRSAPAASAARALVHLGPAADTPGGAAVGSVPLTSVESASVEWQLEGRPFGAWAWRSPTGALECLPAEPP
ncbi:MAG: hypothetical protein R3F56_09050 [Planctomycetota bacterium]